MKPVLQLRLEPDAVLFHNPATAAVQARIDVGYASLDQRFFQQRLDASAIERAIEWTEDRIQAAHFQPDAHTTIETQDTALRQLALLCGVAASPRMVLHLDAVEQCFGRLVLQVQGQSAPQDSLPASGAFAARVVLLRELMHHLHLAQIHIVEAAMTPAPTATAL